MDKECDGGGRPCANQRCGERLWKLKGWEGVRKQKGKINYRESKSCLSFGADKCIPNEQLGERAELTEKVLCGKLFLWECYNELEVGHQKETGKDTKKQIIWTNRPFHMKK